MSKISKFHPAGIYILLAKFQNCQIPMFSAVLVFQFSSKEDKWYTDIIFFVLNLQIQRKRTVKNINWSQVTGPQVGKPGGALWGGKVPSRSLYCSKADIFVASMVLDFRFSFIGLLRCNITAMSLEWQNFTHLRIWRLEPGIYIAHWHSSCLGCLKSCVWFPIKKEHKNVWRLEVENQRISEFDSC